MGKKKKSTYVHNYKNRIKDTGRRKKNAEIKRAVLDFSSATKKKKKDRERERERDNHTYTNIYKVIV